MIKHIDLKDFALAKRCNYAEYTFVVNKLADMLSGEDKSMLNFPKGVFERFQDGATKMLDTLNSSRATAETTKIGNMNKLLNKHLVYILGVVRLAKNSGIEDKCEAAKELYCITKMYRKTRRAPRRQKSSQIGSLIYDLNSPKAVELIKKLSLTEEVNIQFVEDDNEREALPIIGYVGYYRLVNGAEKTIYMTKQQIENHEKKFRKGDYMGKGWKDDWDAMARKTVYRRLIGKWGVMSLDYQNQGDAMNLANQMEEEYHLDNPSVPEAEFVDVDTETGEVVSDESSNAV